MMLKKLSISAIDLFASCPKKFEHRYILKTHMPSNEHFIFGSLGHSIAESTVRGVPLETIQLQVEAERESGKLTAALEKLKINDLREFVDITYKEVHNAIGKKVVVLIEAKLEDSKNLGYVDIVLVDKEKRSLHIWDWKFTKNQKGLDDLLINAQPYMYAKLLDKHKNIGAIMSKFHIEDIYIGYVSLPKFSPIPPDYLPRTSKLSIAKSKAGVTYSTFTKAILTYGLDADDYKDHLDYLKNKTLSSVYEIRLLPHELEEKVAEIEKWNKLIDYARKNNLFPEKMNAYECGQCEIKKLCKGVI